MTTDLEKRLSSIEEDLNRILEFLQESTTVDIASQYIAIADKDSKDIYYRLKRIENRITALLYKWQQAIKNAKT